MEFASHEPIVIYRSSNEAECRQYALALSALGIEHLIRREAGEVSIWVSPADAELSLKEIIAYASENRDWPPVAPAFALRSDGWSGVLCYAIVLFAAAILEQRDAFGVSWFEIGQTNAGLIRQGQWWRSVTALCLHNDLSHLAGNLMIGGWVGLFAGRMFGSGRAWFCIVLAGALGNILNALVRQAGHTSVGASTAIFAALGLLAANGWRRRRTVQTSRMDRWAPLIGGAVLLGYLGTGGERTDIGAHLFGFLAGVLLAAVFNLDTASTARKQAYFGFAAFATVVVAWGMALGRVID